MKQNITQEEFNEKLKSSEEFYDEIFNFGDNDFIFPTILSNSIKFTDCSFTGKILKIIDVNLPEFGLMFSKCTFRCNVQIKNSTLNSIFFEEIKEIENIDLYNCRISELKINNSNINGYINFFRSSFTSNFGAIGNNVSNKFEINKCIFPENSNYSDKTTIAANHFKEIVFSFNKFSNHFQFIANNIESDKESRIESCHFKSSMFSYSIFNSIITFVKCNFESKFDFSQVKGNKSSLIRFRESNFINSANFNYLNIPSLCLIHCSFSQSVYLQDCSFKTITIYNSIFDKIVLFDDTTIQELDNCDRQTLRTVKQQLQKTDNKIDYNLFRSYELQAYYNELKTKGTSFWDRDRLILYATKHVTGFDHSWQKALGFILLAAFIFFSLFFVSENYDLPFAWSGFPQYITGYFRFLIVTDFYNPLSNGREYIANDSWNHIVSWFFFILGKIFIAFGIYEMIQAFRKFKA